VISLDDIQGHWVRDWIKAPGFEDHTTRVHWIQVGSLYADIRVPLERPDLSGAGCLADVPPATLLDLLRAEGFAGHITLSGSQCTWHREINWHGQSDELDVGALSFDPDGRLIEEGVHATYSELWSRGPEPASRAFRYSGDGYEAYLVICGTAFVLGIGRCDKPATTTCLKALKEGRVPETRAGAFDGVHAYGEWSNGEAIATLATQPFSEGQVVARLSASGLDWECIGFNGHKSTRHLNLVNEWAS